MVSYEQLEEHLSPSVVDVAARRVTVADTEQLGMDLTARVVGYA